MTDLDDLLRPALHDLAEQAPHDPRLAEHVRHRARRARTVLGGCVAAGLAAAAVGGVATARALAPRPGTGSLPAAPGPGVTPVPACHSGVRSAVLPLWARAGFSDPEPVIPYARSAGGDIVAVLFGSLTAPPTPGTGNKVLWVWRQYPPTGGPVRLTARLDGTGPAVTAGLPAPLGPSGVDLPSAGCWRLTITWPGGQDSVDLDVAPGPSASTGTAPGSGTGTAKR